jgi:AcrR family transcriptional regulator
MARKKRTASVGAPDNATQHLALFVEMESDRRRDVLLAAVDLFARKGYKSVSVREIAQSVGVLGGSLYHHIKSKEELFLEVHGEVMRVARAHIQAAVEQEIDPWERLRVACRVHLQIHLRPASFTMPLMDDLSVVSRQLRKRLVAQRDQFERLFRDLVDELPLSPEIDRTILRLSLLTLLNNVLRWYQRGRLSPTEIADQIFQIYRRSAASI